MKQLHGLPLCQLYLIYFKVKQDIIIFSPRVGGQYGLTLPRSEWQHKFSVPLLSDSPCFLSLVLGKNMQHQVFFQ